MKITINCNLYMISTETKFQICSTTGDGRKVSQSDDFCMVSPSDSKEARLLAIGSVLLVKI